MTTFENSFIPSTAKALNELPAESRYTDYIVLQLKQNKKSHYSMKEKGRPLLNMPS